MALQRLVLLRHGRTAWNAEWRMQGRLDPDLDEVGRAQAKAAAPVVAAYEPVLVVASDLARAWTTAGAVAEATGRTPRPEARLQETSVGEWEGLTADEVEDGWPGALEQWRQDASFTPPGGESRVDVAQRARPVVDEVVAELEDVDAATGLLVAHGGTIMGLTASTLGWPPAIWPTLRPLRNCHWAVLDRSAVLGPDAGRWRLAAWGAGAE